MALVQYDPFALMNQLQKEMNRVFESRMGERGDETGAAVTSDWVPAVDVLEEKDRFVIFADVPGVDAKEIDVTMENGMLTIRGTRAQQEGNGYKRRERPAGVFYRRFVLPDTADAESISAQGKNGVLQVSIAKRQQAQPRRIQVDG